MLSYYRLDEALSWLQAETGRAWTDSELFDVAVRHGISLSAFPPRGTRCAVFVFDRDGASVKMQTFGEHIKVPCTLDRWEMARVFPFQVAELWHAGETETVHVKRAPTIDGSFWQGKESGEQFWFLAPDGKQPQAIRVTRDNLRLSADELSKVLECWRGHADQGPRTLLVYDELEMFMHGWCRQDDDQQEPESVKQAEPRVERRAGNGRRDDDLSTRDRNTLLKLLIGLAMHGYGFDPASSRNTAPREIADNLAELGIPELSVTDDTVRKWLKVAAETLLPKKLD